MVDDPRWRQLLYYTDGDRSEILDPEFFVSPEGRRSPAAELRAEIDAWFGPETGEARARCRFPARYSRLAERLDLPQTADPSPCARFEAWARLPELRSISVMMVAGYFSNPGSSFGHTLIKLNYERGDRDALRLLDNTVSFGALIPPDEPTLLYVAKGLGGGYLSGFSDKLYYSHDQVYSHTEFRDIWEYPLELSAAERELLMRHLFEVIGRHFTYWFLTKNCAYRMAELFTHATGDDYTPAAHLWFTPVELFHVLKKRSEDRGDPLMLSTRFVPSEQRVLYQRFAALTDAEAAAVNRVIESGATELAEAMAGLDERAQVRALDVLVSYYGYQVSASEEGPDPEMVARRERVLRARFALPASDYQEPVVPALVAPTEYHPPFGVGVAAIVGEGGAGFALTATPYSQDLIDLPERGVELVVAETRLVMREGNELALEQLDLIRLKRLVPNAVGMYGESSMSWQVRAGLRRTRADGSDARAELAGGIGRATLTGERSVAYGMVDLSLRADAPRVRIEPNVGYAWRSGLSRFEAELRPSFDVVDGGSEVGARVAYRRSLSRDVELDMVAEHLGGASEARIGVTRYW